MQILERINCNTWNKTKIHKKEWKWSQEEHIWEDGENWERFLTRKHTGTEEDEDGHACNSLEFPFDETFINSGNVTIITILKKVKQVGFSATYEHTGKNTKYPFCS